MFVTTDIVVSLTLKENKKKMVFYFLYQLFMLWMPSIKLKSDETVPSDTFTAILKMLIMSRTIKWIREKKRST